MSSIEEEITSPCADRDRLANGLPAESLIWLFRRWPFLLLLDIPGLHRRRAASGV